MKPHLIISSLLVTSGLANAATMLTSNFDGNDATTDPTVATGLTWTTDSAVTMGNSGNLAAVGDTFAVLGNISTVDNITMTTNLNTNRATPRGFSFSFTTTSNFDLTNLQVISAHLNSSGGGQVYTSDLNWSISGGVGSGSTNIDYAGSIYKTTDFDLTGTTLGAGTYTLTVDINNMVGGGAYASFDGVTLSGTTAPEPSSAALLGLGGIALLIRRRK